MVAEKNSRSPPLSSMCFNPLGSRGLSVYISSLLDLHSVQYRHYRLNLGSHGNMSFCYQRPYYIPLPWIIYDSLTTITSNLLFLSSIWTFTLHSELAFARIKENEKEKTTTKKNPTTPLQRISIYYRATWVYISIYINIKNKKK